MDPPFTSPASSPQPIGSYFDLVKPISIPNTTSFHHDLDLDGILPDQDADRDDFPEYLKSFHDSGISEARLKRFNWLHPKNYSGAGSLSDDYSLLSPYGTSVSSPRGDEWEIVDNGPRKNIDELWDEVFEYRQRIKLLEEVYQAQAAAAAAEAQCPDLGQIEQGDELRTGTRLSSEMLPDRRWSEYGGGSETCYSPSSMTGSTVSTVTPGLVLFVTTRTTATLGETPMVICSGTIMTQIDRTTIYASRKGVRSDRGSATRLLLSAFRSLASSR